MLSHTVLLLLCTLTTSFSFVPTVSLRKGMKVSTVSMSASQSYLQNLQPQIFPVKEQSMINVYDELKLQNAESYNKTNEVHVDTIYMNIYKCDNIFFNRNSKSVIFHLKNHLQDVFYCEDEKIYKLTNTTRITSKAFKKFIVGEMDTNIDAIIYHQEKV
jgi:hypothetical protein